MRAILLWRLGCYRGKHSPYEAYEGRSERGAQLLSALERQISQLEKMIPERTVYEDLLVDFWGVYLPMGTGHDHRRLSDTLRVELARLVEMRPTAKALFSKKGRWDVRNLIFAQGLVRQWGVSRGLDLLLGSREIAELIDLANLVYGDHLKITDPENIRKAIDYFRDNPLNQPVLSLIEAQIAQTKAGL
jgi:hypothetical protein